MSTRKNVNYVSRACDFCKGRHKKCDGEKPCFACKQRNHECVYSKKVKKRGPKPKREEREKHSNKEKTKCYGTKETNSLIPPLSPPSSPGIACDTNLVAGVEQVTHVPPSTPTKRLTAILVKLKRTSTCKHHSTLTMPCCYPGDYTYCDLAVATFLKVVLPWYPRTTQFQQIQASQYWRFAKFPVEGSTEEVLANSFLYNNIFAHGSRLIGNEAIANEFANKAFVIMNHLFLSKAISKAEIAEKLLQGLVLFIPFVVANHQIARSRAAIMHAFTLWNTFRDMLPDALVYRVYVHMVGISPGLQDRDHWLKMAIKLGSRAATLENRAAMALMLVFSCGVEDLANRALGDHLCSLLRCSESQRRHYFSILQYMDDCETEVTKTNTLVPYHPSFTTTSCSPPNTFCKHSREEVQAFQLVIACSKCYIHSLYGNTSLAITLAQQAITVAPGGSSPLFFPVLNGLARVLKVLQDHSISNLFLDGVKLMRDYCRSFPHAPYYQSLESDPSAGGCVSQGPDHVTDADLHCIRAFCAIPSPLSVSPLALLKVETFGDVTDENDTNGDTGDGHEVQNNLRTYHYHYQQGQSCPGGLDDSTLPMDPLFPSTNDPMVLDDLMELKYPHEPQENASYVFEEGVTSLRNEVCTETIFDCR